MPARRSSNCHAYSQAGLLLPYAPVYQREDLGQQASAPRRTVTRRLTERCHKHTLRDHTTRRGGTPIMTTDVPGDGAVLLTVVEAAKRLRIGRTKMYSLITSGAVKTVTIGALRRVPVEALPEYVARLLAEGSDNNEPAA